METLDIVLSILIAVQVMIGLTPLFLVLTMPPISDDDEID